MDTVFVLCGEVAWLSSFKKIYADEFFFFKPKFRILKSLMVKSYFFKNIEFRYRNYSQN